MTQQYLVGELSQLLAALAAAADGDRPTADVVDGLRREAERLRPAVLGGVVMRALAVGDELCWKSLDRGELATFSDQASVLSDLYEFGVCARLIAD